MNGLEKITTRIADEAKAEASEVLREAKAAAKSVLKDYELMASTEYDNRLQYGKNEIEQETQRLDRAVRLENKKNILALKQELIANTFEEAKKKILSLPEGEYAAFLARQAEQAVSTGKEEILLNEADAKRVGAKVVELVNAALKGKGLPAQVTLSKANRPISGGIVLKNGDVEVNCSLDSLLELSRNTLDAEVAGILFS